jgi:hypothetical protein
VSPVKYELGFYIPENEILHSHRRENLVSYQIFIAGISTRGIQITDELSWLQESTAVVTVLYCSHL